MFGGNYMTCFETQLFTQWCEGNNSGQGRLPDVILVSCGTLASNVFLGTLYTVYIQCTETIPDGPIVTEISSEKFFNTNDINNIINTWKLVQISFSPPPFFFNLFCASVFILGICDLNQILILNRRRKKLFSLQVSHWEMRTTSSFNFAFSNLALEKVTIDLLRDSF